MASFQSLILFLFTIALNIYKSKSSCSFNINATAQTPFRFNNLTTRSPDCDDTAIIINEVNMSDSLIAGTLKKGGLELYRLNGNLLQSIPAPNPPNNDSNNKPGRFNNVAAINCLLCDDTSSKLVIVTDRGLDQLRFYMLNSSGLLDDVTSPSIPYVFSTNQTIVNEQQTAYGLTATTYGGIMRALVSKEHQNIVAVVEIMKDGDYFTYNMTKEDDYITLPIAFDINGMTWKACVDTEGEAPQVEGMAVDPDDGTLLIAVEDVGLFKTSLNKGDNGYNITLIDAVREFGVNYTLGLDDENETVCIYDGMDYYDSGTVEIMNGRNIAADAEGLSLYADNMTNNGGYYVLSCQGGSFFNIYSRNSFKFMGNFSIYYGMDKVEHTDGVEIASGNFGNMYPDGIIIVQDEGENGAGVVLTNFKIASFEYILDGIEECDEDINMTSFYTTGDDNNHHGGGGSSSTDTEDHKTTITILGIVFGVLFVAAIALCLYFSCLQNCGKNNVKSPDNYVELQNK